MQGTVKWFNDEKGFGFITSAKGSDLFVHWKDIISDSRRKSLKDGDSVQYDEEQTAKGPKAINVKKIN